MTNEKNWEKWVYNAMGDKEPVMPALTDDRMIESILNHDIEERGFFQEMVAWLRRCALKKLKVALLSIITKRDRTYEHLCEVVYKMGFRASDILERRMILGETNEWVRKYFKDFPP
jgi:hypothetical protein